ncbi:MAG TPA: hypothetical protein PL041_04605 [Melioribacteraceae bacterium]|nr:hypothetical protein [Melioribacteraceae bacterium]
MKINEEILQKLSLIDNSDFEKELETLIKLGYSKDEIFRTVNSLRKLDATGIKLNDDYKSSLIVKVNNKVNKTNNLIRLNKISYVLYISLFVLFSIFIYSSIGFERQTNNQIITFNNNDKAILNQLKEEDIVKSSTMTDLVETKIHKSNITYKPEERIKDDELVAIAEENKFALSDNYIPGVDDVLLYECADEEMLKSIFKNL